MSVSKNSTTRKLTLLADDYATVETDHPELIALDSEGCLSETHMDFFHWERTEMCTMSAASEIAHNVWLGPTPDPVLACDAEPFDLMVEASDLAQIPEVKSFRMMEEYLEHPSLDPTNITVPQLEFPGSGAIMPPSWSHAEADGLLAMCEWLHSQAHGIPARDKRRDSKLSLSADIDADGDSLMRSDTVGGRRILIHCTDGYTETSLLALAYYMYAECVPVHDAWIGMHFEKKRNFFAYSSDVALLRAIQPRLLQASPKHDGNLQQLCPATPAWLEKMDGSLPSRVLDYMYLGNLGHANNPGLLRELGIGQILSVGEPISWGKDVTESWPAEELCFVDKVQDNGVDPLTNEFSRCLEFIGELSPVIYESCLTLSRTDSSFLHQPRAVEEAQRHSSTAASASRVPPPSASPKS